MRTLNLNEYGVKELTSFETKHIDGGYHPIWDEIFRIIIEELEKYQEPAPLPKPNPWYTPGQNTWEII